MVHRYDSGKWYSLECDEIIKNENGCYQEEGYIHIFDIGNPYCRGAEVWQKNEEYMINIALSDSTIDTVYIVGFPSFLMFLKEYEKIIGQEDIRSNFVRDIAGVASFFNKNKIEEVRLISQKTENGCVWKALIYIGEDKYTIAEDESIEGIREILKREFNIQF